MPDNIETTVERVERKYFEIPMPPTEALHLPLLACPGTSILVVQDDAPETFGEIELPDQARRAPKAGTVVCIGPEVCEAHLSVGRRVAFAVASRMSFEFGPLTVQMYDAEDVVGIFGNREVKIHQSVVAY
jgi:co-chaperonin GroES (HSP10)